MANENQLTLVTTVDVEAAPSSQWIHPKEGENVVLQDQPLTKIHWNRFGQLVVLQPADCRGDESEDQFVYFNRDQVGKLIAALAERALPEELADKILSVLSESRTTVL